MTDVDPSERADDPHPEVIMGARSIAEADDAVITRMHPGAVHDAHARVLASSTASSRFIDTDAHRRTHVIEAGSGRPVVLLHGGGPSALLFTPLIDRLRRVRAIAADRPGFGLSDPDDAAMPYRERAVAWTTGLLDGLGLDDVALVGSSMGGTWAIWFALAHPARVRRLVLLGAPPLAPGTRVPPPLLRLAHPDPSEPTGMPPPPSPESVIASMGMMGEGDTIIGYPDHVDALTAAAGDEVARGAAMREHRATLAPTGWRPELEITSTELGAVSQPTMLVWGDRDPVGGADVARDVAATFADASLRIVPTGHAPWLRDPQAVAELLDDYAG